MNNLRNMYYTITTTLIERLMNYVLYKYHFIYLLFLPLSEILAYIFQGKFIGNINFYGTEVSFLFFMVVSVLVWDLFRNVLASLTKPFIYGVPVHYFYNTAGILAKPIGFVIFSLFTWLIHALIWFSVAWLLAGIYIPFELLFSIALIVFLTIFLLTGISLFFCGIAMKYKENVEDMYWVTLFILEVVSLVTYPLAVMPGWAQPFILANPLAHTFIILRGILFLNMSLLAYSWNLLYLWIAGIFFVGLGYKFFAFMLYRARIKGTIILD